MRPRVLTQRPNPKQASCNDEESRSGWGHQLTHQLQSAFVSTVMQLLNTFQTDTPDFIHRVLVIIQHSEPHTPSGFDWRFILGKVFTQKWICNNGYAHRSTYFSVFCFFFYSKSQFQCVHKKKHGVQLHSPAIRFFALHINDGINETSSFSLIVTKERVRWPFKFSSMGNLRPCH